MLGVFDLAILGAYLACLLLLGWYLKSRADKGVEHYFLSGKNLPWWVAGTSMAASAFSADTPLYVTDITRSGGVGANWEWWCYAIGGAFSVYFLARLWRRAGVLTDVELVELRYDGLGAKLLRGFKALSFSIFINCISMALVIKAISSILSGSLGVDPALLLPVCLAVTLIYSVFSGFWGVVVTDFIQFFLALSGALLLAFMSLKAVGNLDGLNEGLRATAKGQAAISFLPQTGTGFWKSLPVILAMLFGVQWWAFINADGGGKIIQRQLACANEREAARATLWFLFSHYVLRSWPWIIVALCSMVLMPQMADGTRAYTAMMLEVLPDGLKGFMLATFLAAFMSTIDTQLNWGTSYFVNDFYRRFLRPKANNKHLLLVSRIASVAFLLLAGIFSSYSDSVTSIFRFLLSMGAGIGPILILRWFYWRVNAWTELSAMLVSMCVASVCRYYGLSLNPSLLITMSISLPVSLLVTIFTPAVKPEQLKLFVMRTRPFGLWEKYRCKESRPDSLLKATCAWICLSLAIIFMLLGSGWLIFGQIYQGVFALIGSMPLLYYALKEAERN